jgi:hypothetical protein
MLGSISTCLIKEITANSARIIWRMKKTGKKDFLMNLIPYIITLAGIRECKLSNLRRLHQDIAEEAEPHENELVSRE